jgi:hypothetical protein
MDLSGGGYGCFIHAPMRERREQVSHGPSRIVQAKPPCGSDDSGSVEPLFLVLSTPPMRERHFPFMCFSNVFVSIHAPHAGATPVGRFSSQIRSFNPRPHAGSDIRTGNYERVKKVSITPMRGATGMA